MSRIAIIPARGGSRRIPLKNIREFHGKPIIAYSIETALRSKLFDMVVVSTDESNIAKVAVERGAHGVQRRKPHLALDSAGTQEVARDVLEDLLKEHKWFEECCVIYPTAPMMTEADLHNGLELLTSAPEQFVYVHPVPSSGDLCDPGQWYWGRSIAFLRGWGLRGPRTLMLPIDNDRVCDINTEDDWRRAEKMYAALKA